MANVDVKISSLKSSAQREKEVARQIQQISGRIESLAGQIVAGSAAMESVSNSLRACSSNVVSTANKVKILGETLETIATIYQKAESGISGQKSGKLSIADAIERTMDEIRSLSGAVGMDGSSAYSSDPVNLSNGNYVYEKNIFHFDTILSMNMRFFYNIQDEKVGALGRGWIHNFERKVLEEQERTIVVDEDGAEQGFVKRGDSYIPMEGTMGQLISTADGYSYVDEENITYLFHPNGQLKEISTQDGWKITLTYEEGRLVLVECTDQIALSFAYNISGKLYKIEDHTGRTIQLKYKNDMISEIIDPEGNVTGYRYSKNGCLTEIVSPTGQIALKNTYDEMKRTVRQEFPDGGTVSYQYDDLEKAVIMTRQNGSQVSYYHDSYYRNTKVVYTDGTETTEYNNNHQRTLFIDKAGNKTQYAYDYKGNLISVTNPLGSTMELQYNDANQVTELYLDGELFQSSVYDDKLHQISSMDANGGTTYFSYDEIGRPVKITHEDGSNTELIFDDKGNIICVKDPRSGETLYEYDDCHRAVRTTDALGNVTKYEYNGNDQIVKVEKADGSIRKYQYDKKGNIEKIIDFNGGITTFAYNSMNKPIKVTDADGRITEFEYDTMWNPVKKTMPDGGVFQYGYDAEGRMNWIQNPMGEVEKAEYDPMGNLIKRIAPDGGVYQMEYDALNRLISVTDPVGGTKRAVYDVLGNVTEIVHEDGSTEHYTYDAVGNKTSYTDQNGYTKYFTYSILRNLTEVRDGCGVLAKYEYLPGGLLYRETRQDQATAEYTYDKAGNVIRVVDSAKGSWEFEYDSLGNVVSAKHGDTVESYTYDSMGNMTSVTDGCGNKTTYEYTKAGALVLVHDANGTETGYEYDPCYRLKRILQPESGHFESSGPGVFHTLQQSMRVTEYVRDLNGNVLSVSGADGTKTEFIYDACGRVVHKTDGDGNWTSCQYRLDGLEEQIDFSDGHAIKYHYNELKQLAAIEDWLGTISFKQDAVGRLKEVKDHEGNTVLYERGQRGECREIIYPDGRQVLYNYDEHMRLSGSLVDAKNTKYSYYGNGKLKEKVIEDSFSATYQYDSLGRIMEIRNYQKGVLLDQYQYEYDRCNRKTRLIEKHNNSSIPSADYRYSYNRLGNLLNVEKDGGFYQKYEYDIWGNRTAFYQADGTTKYEYDRFGRLAYADDGVNKTAYRYDNRGNLCETSVNGIRKLSLHFDALNRLTEAVSEHSKSIYQYNGMDMLVGKQTFESGRESYESYMYDYSRDIYNILSVKKEGAYENVIWDTGLHSTTGTAGTTFYFNDERLNPVCIMNNDIVTGRIAYDSFGQVVAEEFIGINKCEFAFTGYRKDTTTGFYNGNKRQYDSSCGRFISCDMIAGSLLTPITLNSYAYSISDPINHYDPTGMVVAWLAGGLIGAVVNVGTKFAGDVVESVKNGEWSGSSWQEYTGAAAGGFVQGTVFVIAGPTAAGAAGAATETLITNGLNMATGVEGYTAEDDYSFGDLLFDTGKSAAGGAIAGFTFGQAAKYIKIPGLTSGKGNYAAIWKQVMTKARNGTIANVTWKTIYKGLVSFGLVKTADTIISKGWDSFKDWLKDKATDYASDKWNQIIRTIFPTSDNATCPAAGV